MANVLDNAVWVLLVVCMFIALGLGYNIIGTIFLQTSGLTNATLSNFSGQNLLDPADPNYNFTKTVYLDNLPRFAEMKTFWLDAITFLTTMLIAFMFFSSFGTNNDIIEYAYLFICALIVSSVINYIIIELYNAVTVQFATIGFTTEAFSAYFINNYQIILVLNILGFLGNVIFQKLRYGVMA